MKKNNLSAFVLGLLIAIIGGLLIGVLAVSSSVGKIALLLFVAVACGITVGLRCSDDNETRGILGGICGAALFAVYHLTLLYNGYEYQHTPGLYIIIGIIGCTIMSAGCAVKTGEALKETTSSQSQNSSSTSQEKTPPTTSLPTAPKPTPDNTENNAKELAKEVAQKWKK